MTLLTALQATSAGHRVMVCVWTRLHQLTPSLCLPPQAAATASRSLCSHAALVQALSCGGHRGAGLVARRAGGVGRTAPCVAPPPRAASSRAARRARRPGLRTHGVRASALRASEGSHCIRTGTLRNSHRGSHRIRMWCRHRGSGIVRSAPSPLTRLHASFARAPQRFWRRMVFRAALMAQTSYRQHMLALTTPPATRTVGMNAVPIPLVRQQLVASGSGQRRAVAAAAATLRQFQGRVRVWQWRVACGVHRAVCLPTLTHTHPHSPTHTRACERCAGGTRAQAVAAGTLPRASAGVC